MNIQLFDQNVFALGHSVILLVMTSSLWRCAWYICATHMFCKLWTV